VHLVAEVLDAETVVRDGAAAGGLLDRADRALLGKVADSVYPHLESGVHRRGEFRGQAGQGSAEQPPGVGGTSDAVGAEGSVPAAVQEDLDRLEVTVGVTEPGREPQGGELPGIDQRLVAGGRGEGQPHARIVPGPSQLLVDPYPRGTGGDLADAGHPVTQE